MPREIICKSKQLNKVSKNSKNKNNNNLVHLSAFIKQICVNYILTQDKYYLIL